MTKEIEPSVSVIIPVLDDLDRLKICLKALENQTYPKERYKVIVVDNGSNEDIQGSISQFNQAILVYEPNRGSYNARNRGISIAEGEIIAFTDSDCIPNQDWIEKGVRNLLQVPNFGLVAGKVEIFFRNPDGPTVAELFEKVTAFRQKEYIKQWHFGASANMFTFKKVLDKVGLFDGTLKSGADLEWGKRVFQADYKQKYADDVCMLHPARYSLRDLFKKHARIVGGLHNSQRKKGYNIKRFIIDLKDDWPQFGDFINIFSETCLKRNIQKIQVLLVMTLVKIVRITERLRLYFSRSWKFNS